MDTPKFEKIPARYVWEDYSEDQLLQTKLCDLGLHIKGTQLQAHVKLLNSELKSRGLKFRPHVWLSSEWFSPQGSPGIAIPFYLAHPRLMDLEKKFMLEVEGGTQDWCLKILRHEAGHAIESAYQLTRRKQWRLLFGKPSQPYPKFYQPRPYSRSYVLHLDLWYAQSHPVEDFAETFAVWLTPNIDWRSRYAGWPVLKKLEYVDSLMTSLVGKKPPNCSKSTLEPIQRLNFTLQEYFDRKQKHYRPISPSFYDRELRRIFSDSSDSLDKPPAANFLKRLRPELRRVVSFWTGQYQYTIDSILNLMIVRCRELNLRLRYDQDRTRIEAFAMISVQTVNYLHAGHHRIVL